MRKVIAKCAFEYDLREFYLTSMNGTCPKGEKQMPLQLERLDSAFEENNVGCV